MCKILGKYKTIGETAKDLGLTPGAVYTRRCRGWTLEESLGIVPRAKKEKVEKISLRELAKNAGVNYGTAYNPGLLD